nr:hypothetical protein [Tanacetum cinerariifolium]
MPPLTFADTHNMVAYLSKSDVSAEFDQIVDFINAHVIQYALMVNLTIYISCIKQFWASATIKKINDVIQLRTLIDGKKKMVKKLDKKKKSKSSGLKRLRKTLIKMKAKKAKLLDEQMAQSLHDEEVEKAAAREKVGGITEAYQSFEDMLKGFDREDLVALWRLVKEKFSSAVPNVDKEKALWVELKRLFEPDAEDVLWKLQRHDMFMLTKKNYPLSNGVMILMLSAKLQVEEDSDMARDLVMKIFMEANKPKSISKDDSATEVAEEITLNLESLLTISPSIYALPLDRFDNNVSFEEELVHQRLRKTLTRVLEISSCIYLDDRAWEILNFDSTRMRL